MNRSVNAWSAPVVLPTYDPYPADKNPMFLEKRVYQGSSGRVYPLPFTDRIATESHAREWAAIHMENEFFRLMILPEIGGRIHVGFDKTNGYDFFYRQNVIKPALVGLAGSWISGGVEFNWPQHHRPATFLPVQTHIERHPDGSVTVWCSDHDPMNRLKGMHGICLHPGKAYVELKVRLYNRTPFVQTFLWWANVAVRVHEQYQSFLPPDVLYVADHARRAVSRYPLCEGLYYGVDYGRRAAEGVPPDEMPGRFVPPGDYAANDLRWYANIPVPTSYMAMGSKEDFFGGYDHSCDAGLIHVANHHIAPGKKQWTWGNHEFGYAWDRNLNDADGPYIELMAGVFTDNQPDFSWLQPYESRTWSQFWYPIQKIGPAKQANRFAALNLEWRDGKTKLGVCVTEPFLDATLTVTRQGASVLEERVNLVPGQPFLREFACDGPELTARVTASSRARLIQYMLREHENCAAIPAPATEPLPPPEIESIEELYITGLHLEQYRHATRYPEPYWEEALRRDPLDSRSNTGLGLLKLRRGELAAAEQHFRRAIERLTRRNANPPNGDSHYHLGLALQYQGRTEEAYSAYYKAVWNYAWQSAGYYQLAEIDCGRGDFAAALEHLDRSLAVNTGNLKARNLKTAILRLTGLADQAKAVARETAAMDPLDCWSRYELLLLAESQDATESLLQQDPQLYLDLAFDYSGAGLLLDAKNVLLRCAHSGAPDHPMIFYVLGWLAESMDNRDQARNYRERATRAPSDYCFPVRIEEMLSLERAVRANPGDAKAHYYLGNLYYDKRRYHDAIAAWESSVAHDASFSIPWRNLGIAYFNIHKTAQQALDAYRRAFACNPRDARLLYEFDQLRKRTGDSPEERMAFLEQHFALVEMRDDLMVEFITLCNRTEQYGRALDFLLSRRFNPWEGGEGLVSGQYVWCHFMLGRLASRSGKTESALGHFEAARHIPGNLGEAKHLLTPETHLEYYIGLMLQNLGREAEARHWWARAADVTVPRSWMTHFRALSLRALGREDEARAVWADLRAFAVRQMDAEIKIDYFATSLPNFLLFEDDLVKRNRIDCLFLKALADLGEGKDVEAVTELRDVVALDKNHLASHEELRLLDQRLSLPR